ncbi:putative ABC transporter ATP-binding protein YfiL [Marinicella pacifica]|uniref:ABC transporter ATP-binding protein YfiL n=1 Tax=Marinicella pacifica TaxID=1171543 RepID=A0A917CGP7_9GAMM|nr:ABC transporter ATP-binding protein [Marinicella pacifica]GGF88207.1 putative ABC transporter ATP-binding protein YfiL [Marinicella pacifica]
MLRVVQISKHFGQIKAVNQVSFEVKAGEIYGLLGPNGAGKSTTIRCLSGLTVPDEGECLINGYSIHSEPIKAKQHLGLVPQDLALYQDLSAHENLQFWGRAYGLSGQVLKERQATVLEQVGLDKRAKEPVKNFSGGMKRRLNFACGMIHQPKALLLDEPTVGVDPQSREHLLNAIESLKQQGTAVLYTTHYMQEAERLCDRVGIIDQGKIIAQGSVAELRKQMDEKDLITLEGQFDEADKTKVADFEVIECSPQQMRLMAVNASGHLSELLARFQPQQIHQASVQQANLESLFIKLTGRELRD